MEKIIINKEFLKDYKSLEIVFENTDEYKLTIEDVLEIHLIVKVEDKDYYIEDGYIKISNNASNIKETYTIVNNLQNTEWDQPLKERLTSDSGVDVTSIYLIDKNNKDLLLLAPYGPLEDIMHGCEIELSNCPSAEIDKEGNILIEFGKSSKQPTRIDNNYHDLIKGWSDAFPNFKPKILKVKLIEIQYHSNNYASIYFIICNKEYKNHYAEIIFKNCKDINVETFFPSNRNCEIVMSKLINGLIYVGIDGLDIDFICSNVYERSYYNKKDD